MLINPEKNEGFKKFLGEFYEEIEFLIPKLSLKINIRDEYKWSVVLDYMILKSLGENLLSRQLDEKIHELLANYKLITSFELQDERNIVLKRLPNIFKEFYLSFFDNYQINPYILRSSLYKMRTDADLKVLFTYFGGKFYPQEQQSFDGTGALYFSRDEFKSGLDSVAEKLSLLNKHLEKGGKSEIFCIALNLGHHWVAVTSIEKETIIFNNPSSGREGRIKINKRFSETCRFYLFSYSTSRAFILTDESISFLKSETVNELNQVKEFTRELLEKFDEQDEVKAIQAQPTNFSEDLEVELVSKNPLHVEEIPEGPLTGDDFLELLKEKIKNKFSDYSKL